MAAFTTSIDITSGGTYKLDIVNGESSAQVASDLNGKMNNLQTILQAKLPETCTAAALPTTLQHGKLIIWNNQLYFGNSSNVPTTVTPTTVPSHTHSASDITSGTLSLARGGTGATSASSACSNIGALPTSGGTITGALTVNGAVHLNNADIRLGTTSTSSFSVIKIGDGDRVHFTESSDDHLEIYASGGINLKSSGDVTINGKAIGGSSKNFTTGSLSLSKLSSNRWVSLDFTPTFVIAQSYSSGNAAINTITKNGTEALMMGGNIASYSAATGTNGFYLASGCYTGGGTISVVYAAFE